MSQGLAQKWINNDDISVHGRSVQIKHKAHAGVFNLMVHNTRNGRNGLHHVEPGASCDPLVLQICTHHSGADGCPRGCCTSGQLRRCWGKQQQFHRDHGTQDVLLVTDSRNRRSSASWASVLGCWRCVPVCGELGR